MTAERDDMAHLIVERASDATPVGYVVMSILDHEDRAQ
jgi:hypothetical protein